MMQAPERIQVDHGKLYDATKGRSSRQEIDLTGEVGQMITKSVADQGKTLSDFDGHTYSWSNDRLEVVPESGESSRS